MVVRGGVDLLHCPWKMKENRTGRTSRWERSHTMLELTHIQKSFDGVTVLKDISMQVEEGEIVSILGPSG